MIVQILEEFVSELTGPEESKSYQIVSNDTGVSFRSPYVSDIKLSLVVSPMFGVPKNHVGIIVSWEGIPVRDRAYKLEDPSLFEKISDRLDQWLVRFKKNRPLKTDWIPTFHQDWHHG